MNNDKTRQDGFRFETSAIHEGLGCCGAALTAVGGLVVAVAMGCGLLGAVGGLAAGGLCGWVAGATAGELYLRYGPGWSEEEDE